MAATPTGRAEAITGGASGMGEASARRFAARGDHVTIIDRDADRAAAVAADLGAATAIGDVSSSEFCTAAIDGVVERHGRIDVLVNAAGTIHRQGAIGTSDDDWRRVLGVNLDGLFFASRAAVIHMQRAGSGAIVNFGSIWGGVGSAGVAAYCASKGAVHQLTRAMALDHATDGIRINAVAPGEVDTPMLSSQRERPPTAADLQALADATIPVRRLARPDEIAAMVEFLASDEASYMTGAIVTVDGGFTAR